LAAGTAATAAAVLLAAANNALTRSAIADSLSPILSIFLKILPVCLDPEKPSKMRKRLSKFYGTRYKNLHRYLRILRYVNWWIFLDSILKINPRKQAIKKQLVKIYTQIQDRTFRTEKHSEKAGIASKCNENE
jgi:flagellin-specific chaperone FliS